MRVSTIAIYLYFFFFQWTLFCSVDDDGLVWDLSFWICACSWHNHQYSITILQKLACIQAIGQKGKWLVNLFFLWKKETMTCAKSSGILLYGKKCKCIYVTNSLWDQLAIFHRAGKKFNRQDQTDHHHTTWDAHTYTKKHIFYFWAPLNHHHHSRN